MTARHALIALIALAAVLRLITLNNALWLDEIAVIQVYGPMTVWQVIDSYAGSNNHLLNTLLMKASSAIFGDGSWAWRLPAFLFGVAGIPALYVTARVALSERASLAAAAMLAVAYHHVFFSQNARGYTAWIVFSLLASAAFARWMEDPGDRARLGRWVGATVGNFASLLLSAFTAAGHGLVGAGLLVTRRHSAPSGPLLRSLALGGGLAALGGLLLYAWVLPDVLAYADTEYRKADVGFSLFSAAFVTEVVRGLGGGVGWLLVIAAPIGAAVGLAGLRSLHRASPVLTWALFSGPALQLAAVGALGLSVTPRHFLLAMPLAFLVIAAGVEALAQRLDEPLGADLARPALIVAVVVFALVSALQLRGYYAHPKQDIPGALAWLADQRQPDEHVVALHLAELPVQYYGPQHGFTKDDGTFFVRTLDALDAAHADPRFDGSGWLVMTLPRALDIGLPELAARVRADYELVETFPGTLGDADVTLWRERSTAPGAR